MIIDKNLIYIDGVCLNKFPILQIKFSYQKMWGSDTGRDTLAGDFSGTFKGIFPTFDIYFGKMTPEQDEEISELFDKGYNFVKYYDPKKKDWIEIECYSGDYSLDFKNVGKSEGFNIQVVSKKRRK